MKNFIGRGKVSQEVINLERSVNNLNAFGVGGQQPIRKISMTCLLSDPSEFTGGDLLFSEMGEKKPLQLKQGQAIFFASFLRHKVAPVKKGIRRSLVMWFGGTPFK